jgi:hypothetical protein
MWIFISLVHAARKLETRHSMRREQENGVFVHFYHGITTALIDIVFTAWLESGGTIVTPNLQLQHFSIFYIGVN